MVSQGIANPSTGLYRCSGSNPDGGVKGIRAANIHLSRVNIFDSASLQAGSYEVFPKSSKETSKICLVYGGVSESGRMS